MKFKINLLQETQEIKSKIRRWGLFLQSLSILILSGFGVLVFAVFSYYFFLSTQVKGLSNKIENRKNDIENLQNVEIKQILVKQKLTAVRDIFKDYGIKQEILTELYKFLVVKGSIGTLTFNDESDEVRFDIVVKDVIAFSIFLEDMISYAKDNSYNKIMLSEINRNSQGNYGFTVTMSYLEE